MDVIKYARCTHRDNLTKECRTVDNTTPCSNTHTHTHTHTHTQTRKSTGLVDGNLRQMDVIKYAGYTHRDDLIKECKTVDNTASSKTFGHPISCMDDRSHCNMLQRAATSAIHCNTLQHTATRCNTLQHAATRCNKLQHAATLQTHGNTLPHTAPYCNTLKHAATHCNILKHTATHCNTLQHTATQSTTIKEYKPDDNITQSPTSGHPIS